MAPMWLQLQDTVKSNISMGREVGTSPTDLVQVVTRGQIMQGMQICDLAAIISNIKSVGKTKFEDMPIHEEFYFLIIKLNL